MPTDITIKRRELVRALHNTPINVETAKRDPELKDLDLAAADLDKDGLISGRRETRALFAELDKKDGDPSPRKLKLIENGRLTDAGEKVQALAVLSKAVELKKIVDEQLSTAIGAGEGAFAQEIISQAGATKGLEKNAARAARALEKGDYATFAAEMWTI